MKRMILILVAVAAIALNAVAEITVSDIEVFSGYPWKEVVIGYTITGAKGAQFVLTAKNLETGTSYEATTTNVSGADLTAGRHVLKWNMAADGIRIKSNRVEFSLKVFELKYCVVNLQDGPNAQSYPVEYLGDTPSGGWTDEYKTTKLVLRLIGEGSFKMGSNKYDVTLTKAFYMGVFEVTQGQWKLVMGSNPSAYQTISPSGKRPVESVSYGMIRGDSAGDRWPDSNAVDSDSFLGKLRAKTGLDFDLPTEAQWEYACRAGTITTYSYGDAADGNYMWYDSSYAHDVGSRLPNPWGLYDMHGNVLEWCLDRDGSIGAATDPVGPRMNSFRVSRGGSWSRHASDCTSSYRPSWPTMEKRSELGFRLCRILQQ